MQFLARDKRMARDEPTLSSPPSQNDGPAGNEGDYMSRYDELCNAYKKYSDDRFAYADRSRDFITKLVDEFNSFLDAPTNRVRFFPPEGGTGDQLYSPAGAATPGEDGWWRIIVQVTLSQGPNIIPELNARMLFQVRTELDKFLVQIGDSKVQHAVTVGSPNEMQPIFNEAFKRSQEYLNSGLQRFLDETGSDGTRKIGFV